MVFADKDVRSIGLTKQNLSKLNIEGRVYKASYEKMIEKLAGENFDVILLDPPYASGVYEDCLKRIYENNLLADGGIIVCEHNKKDEFDYSPFEVVDEKRYGIKMVTYLQA